MFRLIMVSYSGKGNYRYALSEGMPCQRLLWIMQLHPAGLSGYLVSRGVKKREINDIETVDELAIACSAHQLRWCLLMRTVLFIRLQTVKK
ncbi:colanic acid capsullar biosynthesis activation protein A [Salmonella bongori]|nr:colanic acid capsullar biosynthesis activation protein A [Salmonella bongori]